MHVFYSPWTSPDFNSEIPVCLLLVSFSSALTKGYRKHELPLNKGYIEAFFRRFWSFLPVYFFKKPGNMLCFDLEVDRQK